MLLHTVVDAILGALCLPDIGQLFPDTDPRWKGARRCGAAGRGQHSRHVQGFVHAPMSARAADLPTTADLYKRRRHARATLLHRVNLAALLRRPVGGPQSGHAPSTSD